MPLKYYLAAGISAGLLYALTHSGWAILPLVFVLAFDKRVARK